MIKIKENCPVEDIQRQLELQLQYDSDCKVIAIFPAKLRCDEHFSYGPAPEQFAITHVNIIWDSK